MEKADVLKIIERINLFLQKQLWFDFEVSQYERQSLIVVGSIDQSAPHNIEVCFENISFISLPMEWRTDTSRRILTLLEGEEAYKLNGKFQVEIGHHIFQFFPEGYPNDFGCLVAAKKISYSTPWTSNLG